MTRSTKGIGIVRAAVLSGVALGTALLASACGSGQISQTADMLPAVPGANSTPTPGGNPTIQLRNVTLRYPGLDGYRRGSTAALQLHIFNTGERPVTLVRVTSDAASTVVQDGVAAPSSASASASPAAPESPSGSPSASGSESASPSASESAAAGAGSRSVRVTVPADGYVSLQPGSTAWLQLEDLTRDISAGESVDVTFGFDNGAEYTLNVPVAVPTAPAPRGSAVTDESGETGGAGD